MNTIAIQRYVHVNPPKGPQFSGTTVLFGDRMDMLFEDDQEPTNPSTLTVRNSNSVGDLTMTNAHTLVMNTLVDLYWEESGVQKTRRGVLIASTTGSGPGTLAHITSGVGDPLPPVSTVINASNTVEGLLETGLDGKTLRSIVFSAPVQGMMTVWAGGTERQNFQLPLGGLTERHGGMGDPFFVTSDATHFTVSLNNPTVNTFLGVLIFGDEEWNINQDIASGVDEPEEGED